ncbi:hypothetical protein PPTG_05218 [Phytophthora nicotianae INRA-310]|uniref:Uncharacterized protein n=1 Tax=Phytophthora nicotianae (strain INRA-310) TaxID=761204 RepID=W2QW11_PHYN3|nr:hypothetical protein PPTG_05218 [Phytophthora nicotianae INRA-310]ETN17407.1 hypothetical protein PPTG_05218 [Phytophthora nicotianae INRA-310]
MEEQRLVHPRLLKALKYFETWSALSQEEEGQVKKLNAAFAALDSEDKLMEEAIATVGAFMVEMRSVGLSARDVALAETMARRLEAAQKALKTVEKTVAEDQTSMDEVGRNSAQLCAVVGRMLPQLPAGQWLPQPHELRLEIADMHRKQAEVAEGIQDMREALAQMEALSVQARSMTFGQ